MVCHLSGHFSLAAAFMTFLNSVTCGWSGGIINRPPKDSLYGVNKLGNASRASLSLNFMVVVPVLRLLLADSRASVEPFRLAARSLNVFRLRVNFATCPVRVECWLLIASPALTRLLLFRKGHQRTPTRQCSRLVNDFANSYASARVSKSRLLSPGFSTETNSVLLARARYSSSCEPGVSLKMTTLLMVDPLLKFRRQTRRRRLCQQPAEGQNPTR